LLSLEWFVTRDNALGNRKSGKNYCNVFKLVLKKDPKKINLIYNKAHIKYQNDQNYIPPKKSTPTKKQTFEGPIHHRHRFEPPGKSSDQNRSETNSGNIRPDVRDTGEIEKNDY
jgi:hypothetical protein